MVTVDACRQNRAEQFLKKSTSNICISLYGLGVNKKHLHVSTLVYLGEKKNCSPANKIWFERPMYSLLAVLDIHLYVYMRGKSFVWSYLWIVQNLSNLDFNTLMDGAATMSFVSIFHRFTVQCRKKLILCQLVHA